MEASGLNSFILSPFCDALPEWDCQGPAFAPVEEPTCDPYADAVFQALDNIWTVYQVQGICLRGLQSSVPTDFGCPGSFETF